MNKKGSVLLAIVMSIFIFACGVMIMNLIIDDVETAESSSALDCSNSTITDGTKLTCLGTSITIPYVFITIFSIAGGIFTSRFLI